MKIKNLLLAIAAAGSATVAFAQQDPPPQSDQKNGPPPPRPPGPPPFVKVLEAVDTDHDGIVSAEEIAAAPDTLKVLDKNGDGELSKDEFLPPPPPGPSGGGPQKGGQGQSGNNRTPKKTKITTNGRSSESGGQSGDEQKGPPPLPLIIVALDADHDGVISKEEIAGSAEAMKSLDKNDDGQLGPAEYAHPPRPPKEKEDGDEKPVDDKGKLTE